MTSKLLPSDSCRHGGCTLTGALSATTHVRDAVSLIHGPKGCTHHNFSLLHATAAENDQLAVPSLVSTNLAESEIIFGGERVLANVLKSVARRDIGAIYVLSTCVIETIGDDVAGICREEYGVPVVRIPTAGFLGGTFQGGLNNALCAIASEEKPCTKSFSVNIIGEKNLEYEVEENYQEVARLLALIGLSVNLRFIRNCDTTSIGKLGAAGLNILRDNELQPTGEFLMQMFGTPYIASFPVGLGGTIQFMEAVGTMCGIDFREAIASEKELQESMLADFSDIAGEHIRGIPHGSQGGSSQVAGELAVRLGLKIGSDGPQIPVPFDPPIGSAGVRRLLHRWRCAIHA